MKIIAHRCGTDKFPENSLESAKYSISQGAAAIEIDLRFTADEKIVVCHDKNAMRLFSKNAEIKELSLQEFKALPYSENSEIFPLSFEELLRSGLQPILIHIKEGGERLQHILQTIMEHEYLDKVVMGLCNFDDYQICKSLCPSIKTLAFMPDVSFLEQVLEMDFQYIRLWEGWITEERIKKIQDKGKKCAIMAGQFAGFKVGFSKEENYLAWQKMGADYVLTNTVDLVKSLLSISQK